MGGGLNWMIREVGVELEEVFVDILGKSKRVFVGFWVVFV